MIAQLAAIPIATAVGEFAAPYLLRKAGEIGLTRFIQVYGGAAAASIGIQKTQPVDLQTEKIMGMPVSHITGQGEVYDDIDYSAIDEDREVEPLKYIDTVHGGKGPLEPIKAKGFPAQTEVKKWDESFKAPEKIETTEGLEVPPQEKIVPPGIQKAEPLGTDILTQDKKDTLPGIGHNQPPSSIEEQTDDLVTKTKTKHYKGELTETDTLNSDLIDALVSLTGTPEDIAKSSKLPQSHKKKIFWSLEDYITKHYPAKLNEAEGDHEGEALFYITSAIYDTYTNNGKVPNNIILIEDDKGIPMGAAEIQIYPKGKINFYPKRKTGKMAKTEPAIYIEGLGSFNRKITDLLLEKIEFLAEAEGMRYIVGEDLTSEGALKALSRRGFKPGKKGFFEGEIINEAMWRGGKKSIKAKNMVLDLGEKYATTQVEIDKELEKERIQEQTEKLTKK